MQVGDSLKVRCEVRGSPPATAFRWFRNEAPLLEEMGRVKVKSYTDQGPTQWSQLRFRALETLDTGFYRCEASNSLTTLRSNSVIKVNLAVPGSSMAGQHLLDSDYVHLPGTFEDPFDSLDRSV